jgi:hypothetical protein
MKKILTIIIWLVFSNNTFAEEYDDRARCSIVYSQYNKVTEKEKEKYITTQFDLAYNPDGGWIVADPCYRGGKKLAAKINKWERKSDENVLSYVEEVSCKRRTPGIFSNSWSRYETCDLFYLWLLVSEWLDRPEPLNKWSYDSDKKIMKNNLK